MVELSRSGKEATSNLTHTSLLPAHRALSAKTLVLWNENLSNNSMGRARNGMVCGLWSAAQNNAPQIASLLIEAKASIIKVPTKFVTKNFCPCLCSNFFQ